MENSPSRRKKKLLHKHIYLPPMVNQVRQIETVHFMASVAKLEDRLMKAGSEFLMCHWLDVLYLQVNPIVALRLQQCIPKEICPGLAQSRASLPCLKEARRDARQGSFIWEPPASHCRVDRHWQAQRYQNDIVPTADTGTFSATYLFHFSHWFTLDK